MKRIALYARVSTQDQHAEVQMAELRQYAQRRGLEALEYIDEGQSGRKHSRPALDEMLLAVGRREVDAVACVKLDRLARSVRHLTQLAADLEALGVDLVVLDQDINTGTSAGKLLFHVLAAIGEFEADLIRERTRAGLAAARRRGKQLGRPRALSLADVKRVRRLRTSGRTIREIAERLAVGRSTVSRALEG